ncbi:Uncharacterised protein [Oligella urethralis]|uniref:phage tail tip fiber protein n=1 Tax=Oligella urethralis TaxID=90245 RepID=UPI000DFF87B6|nr:DUF1983 domain-containing protein [Oligella urethralis]SUA63233.1 Uncharacterised protein [Oligella urethralis]
MEIFNIVCGTGGTLVPNPGDPSNVYGISTFSGFGLIKVMWEVPVTNPQGVAHYEVWRSTTPNFSTAKRIARVGGDSYTDTEMEEGVPQYYWVATLAMSGIRNSAVGPAMGVAKPGIGKTMDALTNQINEGMLAQGLKERINKIEDLENGLTEQAKYNENEIEAIGTFLKAMQGTVGDAIAAVQEEASIRATELSAMASQVNTIQSSLGSNIASVETTAKTWIDALDGKTKSLEDKTEALGALYHVKVDVNGLVGGFGIHNTGKTVEAGFDVNRFWVGSGNAKRKPFIIDNGNVYINNAFIRNLGAGNIAANAISSTHINAGVIEAKHIKTNAVNANHLNVGSLSTISANMGIVTAGTINMKSSGWSNIRSNDKWIGDSKNGWIIGSKADGNFLEFKYGNSMIRMGSGNGVTNGAWINFGNGKFTVNHNGEMTIKDINVIGRAQIVNHAVTTGAHFNPRGGGDRFNSGNYKYAGGNAERVLWTTTLPANTNRLILGTVTGTNAYTERGYRESSGDFGGSRPYSIQTGFYIQLRAYRGSTLLYKSNGASSWWLPAGSTYRLEIVAVANTNNLANALPNWEGRITALYMYK